MLFSQALSLTVIAPPVAQVRSWILKGGAAVIEQALFAGGNFVMNVALARSLPAADYGAFAFTYTILISLTAVHNAFILEPATVLETSRYTSHLRAYCRAQLVLHTAFTACLAAILVAAGMVVSRVGWTSGLGSALMSAGIGCPTILLFWLTRRFMYLLTRSLTAMDGSALYFGIICAGLVVATGLYELSPFVGFLIMGAASAVGALFMLALVARQASSAAESAIPFTMRTLIWERWRYGRWLLAKVCLETAHAPAVTFIVTATLGLAAVGTLRAMQVFMVPITHTMTALSSLALPMLARDFEAGKLGTLRTKSHVLTALVVALALGVELILALFHGGLEQHLYMGKYASASSLIPVFGVAALFEGTAASYGILLSAVRQPRLLLLSSALSAPLALGVSLVCIQAWGVYGAALSFVVTQALATIIRHRLARPWLLASDRSG
ncbi:MAG: lipopolysaccharide biosynthesis protein [Vicinamibacteraceae bacterium]